MLKYFARLAGLTAVLATLVAPSAHAAQFRVGVQIGAQAPYGGPVYGGPSYAQRGFVWQPGYFVGTAFGRRWVPGAWVLRGHVPNGNAYGYWRNRGFDGNRGFDSNRGFDGNRDRRDFDRDDRRFRR